ncbi:MAG: DUF413 domain-containing protein [Flavobacteriales bacterium]|nr:DUF413 domain-containing protein [Flavobacteriales bacterium]
MESLRQQHIVLARKRDFPFECDPRLFSEEQYLLIRRWGYWYQGLSSGDLTPFTNEQIAFVAAVHGDRPPNENHAAAWWRYLKRKEIEEKHGDAMHSSHQVDSDTFYDREMAKQVRKTMGGVNLREHKRG